MYSNDVSMIFFFLIYCTNVLTTFDSLFQESTVYKFHPAQKQVILSVVALPALPIWTKHTKDAGAI